MRSRNHCPASAYCTTKLSVECPCGIHSFQDIDHIARGDPKCVSPAITSDKLGPPVISASCGPGLLFKTDGSARHRQTSHPVKTGLAGSPWVPLWMRSVKLPCETATRLSRTSSPITNRARALIEQPRARAFLVGHEVLDQPDGMRGGGRLCCGDIDPDRASIHHTRHGSAKLRVDRCFDLGSGRKIRVRRAS